MRTQISRINGNTRLTWYHWGKAGEEIPAHVHPDFSHVSIAVRGDFEIFNSAGKTVKLPEHGQVEFAAGQEHGIRSADPHAILLAIHEAGK